MLSWLFLGHCTLFPFIFFNLWEKVNILWLPICLLNNLFCIKWTTEWKIIAWLEIYLINILILLYSLIPEFKSYDKSYKKIIFDLFTYKYIYYSSFHKYIQVLELTLALLIQGTWYSSQLTSYFKVLTSTGLRISAVWTRCLKTVSILVKCEKVYLFLFNNYRDFQIRH